MMSFPICPLGYSHKIVGQSFYRAFGLFFIDALRIRGLLIMETRTVTDRKFIDNEISLGGWITCLARRSSIGRSRIGPSSSSEIG